MAINNYNTKVGPKAGGLLIDALQTIVFALGLSVVVYLFLAIPNQVDGLSMMPNLHNGEILITNKFIEIAGGPGKLFPGYDYQRGDIVVFQQPNRPDLVKRVIGLPGETIKIEGGRVYINGQVLNEEYLPAGRRTDPSDFITEGIEKRVPEGHYFLMGDNRGNSKDSRTSEVGFVRREYIKGSPFLRVFPFSSFGLLSRGTSRLVDAD